MEADDWGASTPSKGRGLDVEIERGAPRVVKLDAPLFASEAEACSFIVVVFRVEITAGQLE